jgi:hypothetical protein
MTEQDLTRAIIEALTARRVWCWRNNAGVTVVGQGKSRRVIRMAPAGSPDIIGVIGNGRMFGLEVKTATVKVSSSQREWAIIAAAHGVRYQVVRSISEALKWIDAWQMGEI